MQLGSVHAQGRIPGHHARIAASLINMRTGSYGIAIADVRVIEHGRVYSEAVSGTDADISQHDAERCEKIAMPDTSIMTDHYTSVEIIGVADTCIARDVTIMRYNIGIAQCDVTHNFYSGMNQTKKTRFACLPFFISLEPQGWLSDADDQRVIFLRRVGII